MCNCNSISICDQCSQGNPCGCPPDYSIIPLPSKCCPDGYNYVQSDIYPNGTCCAGTQGAANVPTIPCKSCSDTISSDCVFLPAIPSLGIAAGTTLTDFAAFLNSETFIETILTKIGIDINLGTGFCQLVQTCPSSGSGSTTPIITGITISF